MTENESRYLDLESRLRYRTCGPEAMDTAERDAFEAAATRHVTQSCSTLDSLTTRLVAARASVSAQTHAQRLGVVKALNERLAASSARMRAMQETRYGAEQRSARRFVGGIRLCLRLEHRN